MEDCLENIIGLTQNDCNCFDGTKPVGFDDLNVSSSGLYVTDEGDGAPILSGLFQSIDCGRGDNVFQVIANARASAITSFVTDFQAFAAQGRKQSEGFIGTLGQINKTGTTTVGSQYAGILVEAPQIRGRAFVLEGIYLGFATAETVTVIVTSNDPAFADVTLDVTNVAGKQGYAAFTAPVRLDFSNGFPYLVYYEVLDKRPINNAFYCCGNFPKYTPYLDAFGYSGSDIVGDLADCCISTRCSNAYGMALNGYVGCDDTSWLCNPERFGKNNATGIIAKTLQFKAAFYAYQYILDSPEINSYTLLSREAIYGKQARLNKAYTDNVKHLASLIPKGSCLGCKESIVKMRRASAI